MAFRGLEGWNNQLRSLGQGSEGGRRQRDEHAVLEAKEKRVREEAFDFPHTCWQPLRWCAHPRELTQPTHSCFPAPRAITPGGLCSPPWAVFLTRPHSTSPTLPIPYPFASHRQLLPSPEKRMITQLSFTSLSFSARGSGQHYPGPLLLAFPHALP